MRKMMFEERLRERKDSFGGDFDKALQIFIADRKRMGCTERTIGWYEEVIGRFFREFLEQKSIPLEPEKARGTGCTAISRTSYGVFRTSKFHCHGCDLRPFYSLPENI